MRTASLVFLMSISVAAQAPRNVIACDPGDAEQCKTTIVEGRPMRAMVHEGTSVAVGMPVATDEGNYRVFIRVTQVGPGKAEVRPKHFSGLYSDSVHTRFAFYDKGAEISQRLREANRTQQADGDDALDTPRRGTGSAQSMGRSKAAKLGMRKTIRLKSRPDRMRQLGRTHREWERLSPLKSCILVRPRCARVILPKALCISKSRGD